MKYIGSALRARLQKAQQTIYQNAEPGAVLWLSRPFVPLESPEFLEKQRILTTGTLSAVSIAARRLNVRNEADRLYVAYISDGVGKVVSAATVPVMSDHLWQDTGFSEPASDIAIAFNGTMPKSVHGQTEFQTESQPWVFWVSSGALYARVLGQPSPVTLAPENVTSVSAVRGMWSDIAGIDVGLVAFFIANGSIYYRQYRGGAWEDGVPLGVGPSLTWVDIAASRTWDYRIALQAKASDGTLWEFFTQFEGVAKQNVEHIEVTDVSASGKTEKVYYTGTQETEHIDVSDVGATGARLYALSPVLISAQNLEDEEENWGKLLQITFDYPVYNLAGNAGAFVITDENDIPYYGTSVVSGEGATAIVIGFSDFNAAVGTCTLSYVPGTVIGPVAMLEAGSVEFIPQNLIPPQVNPPEVEEIWNE